MAFSEEEELAKARAAESAHAQREAEGMFEAARRQRASRAISLEWPRLHAALAPPSPAIEADENDATQRFLPEDTVDTAAVREVGRALRAETAQVLSPSWIAQRILGAYDAESAFEVTRLPFSWITAERVFAHLESFGWEGPTPMELGSIARRLTVVLINKKWLLPYRTGPDAPVATAAPGPVPVAASVAPGAPLDVQLCLECGADLTVAGPRCDACAGLDKTEARLPQPAPVAKPAAKPESRSQGRRKAVQQARPERYDNREMVLDFTGGPRPLPPGVNDPPIEHRQRPLRVLSWARVLETTSFAESRTTNEAGGVIDMQFADLVAGTIVEVLEPAAQDKKDLEKRMEQGRQLVTIRWQGKTRLVDAKAIEGATEGDFEAQEKIP